jgi:NitT/TauT family transport system permease protein
VVLPAVMPNLVYNSILSWANGWYFLTASEIIAAGPARYTLPGLGSYLAQAITVGRNEETLVALAVLLLTTVAMHLLVWSPLETWAERFHVEETGEHPRTPRIGRVLGRSRIVAWAARVVVFPAAQQVLMTAARLMDLPGRFSSALAVGVGAVVAAVVGYGGWRFHVLLSSRPVSPEAYDIPLSLALSFVRVGAGVVLAVLIAVPLAYLSFRSTRTRSIVLSILQILGSVPATAVFPLIALLMLRLGLGMNVGSILLVLTGTFFYVMFNVLSGAASIPGDLDEAAAALGIRGPRYVARVFLPAVLPSLVTGCVTAWGGGWNAIIFSEYIVAGGRRYEVRGIGAMLDRATYVTGDPQVIALSLLSMVVLVVLVNRVFWEPVYQRVAARYKMES